jgi:hypothetical protein
VTRDPPGPWAVFTAQNHAGAGKRPIKEWQGHLGSFHDGLADLSRRLVAAGDRVYSVLGIGEALSALDAATGETVRVWFPATCS